MLEELLLGRLLASALGRGLGSLDTSFRLCFGRRGGLFGRSFGVNSLGSLLCRGFVGLGLLFGLGLGSLTLFAIQLV